MVATFEFIEFLVVFKVFPSYIVCPLADFMISLNTMKENDNQMF